MKKRIMLGTSDTWSTSRLSHRLSKTASYIVDWRISTVLSHFSKEKSTMYHLAQQAKPHSHSIHWMREKCILFQFPMQANQPNFVIGFSKKKRTKELINLVVKQVHCFWFILIVENTLTICRVRDLKFTFSLF